MPSEWRPSWDRWVDERRLIILIWPVSGIAIAGQVILGGWSLYSIWLEDFGAAAAKKAAILSVLGAYTAIMLYLSIGVYQMFFIELRRKFIVREVEWTGIGYKVRGYYFKHADFSPVDIEFVEEYRVGNHYLSSTIITLLNRIPKVNYRVRLKDGRVFYLPADIGRVDQLKAQLESDIRENTQ